MIDFKEKVLLGGFPQKIHVIGTVESNPVLLFLHGGPGVSNRHFTIKSQCDLTDAFTVVAWDQRGTGGSYKGISPKTLTVEQLTRDAYELCLWLCNRFNRKKIFICGGSWGSALGTELAYRHPDVVAAYVGYGQLVDGTLNEKLSYEYAMEKARAANDKEAIEILESVGPPVEGQYRGGFSGLMSQRKIMKKYGGHSMKEGGYIKTVALPMLTSGEYSIPDIVGLIRGYKLVLTVMWPQVAKMSFLNMTHFEMPYYIFQGRHDNNTPSELVEDYYNAIEAPNKDLVWFEHSAHDPLGEEAEKFKSLMREKFAAIRSN